jgi:hypothetical protein
MTPSITVVRDTMGPMLQRYVEVTGRSLAASLKRAAKGVNRRVLAITPPASEGMSGASAFRQGKNKIAKQMNAVLAPVKLKGQRTYYWFRSGGFPTKAGIKAMKKFIGPSWIQSKTVATRERVPNVAAHYRSVLRANNAGTRLVLKAGTRKVWVDTRKFQAELVRRQGAVGRLASGWAEGARVLEIPVNAWIGRHGTGRGTIKLDVLSANMGIVVRNQAPAGLPGPIRAEMQRRIGAALKYQEAAMEREIKYLMARDAQALAIKTRNFSALVPAGMMGGD